ncbi:peptide/nickel transport system substrate-binding protein [Rhodobium orientis]|uniref:ABC transporter substrate-binding protein n=1 Tax=Rhodobium orientis TaxID=34017 RepID=A0A327JQH2_9HYPH|nr:ABC transporter substrate-binding protein [Rhodobium orientis]MBB4301422.1 peptide/nickel transport system substrate-binding protein [Rhodobium orientis]MBK5950990.1 ABC transporter substrate-binding protein [Rhodobium orientis]RAI27644.1 ABC transporter substrate-binding protein [Rhodobium orientis]
MHRRNFLKGVAAGSAAALFSPRLSLAAESRVLKFVPSADVTVVDPVWTTAYVTRNHGYMVFDTLYGYDDNFQIRPQMVAGHEIGKDGLEWRLTLRDGLKFHDGEPVLARDVVASIRRWADRDVFGKDLMAATDELSAASDKVVVFRLKRPFALLPAALGKMTSRMPCIMPERLAMTPPSEQVTEVIGSGPFRFVADERVQGALTVYEKFEDYVPREGSAVGRTGGPKVANVDRVEWHVMPDAATASGALQAGEVDWVESPLPDLLPLLRSQDGIEVKLLDTSGTIGSMRLNHLHPPFDNPAIRRAVLSVIDQKNFMQAVAGEDPSMWRAGVGVFTPESPMASDAGMEVLNGPRDFEAGKAAIAEAGYNGEPVVLLAPSDYAALRAEAEVGADTLNRLGLNVDYQSLDWGTIQQRRRSREPLDKGGWSCLYTGINGLEAWDPSSHQNSRGLGDAGQYGWPVSDELEAARKAWLEAPDLAGQKAACERIQLGVFDVVPYIPLGLHYAPAAFRSTVSNIPYGFAQFYGVTKSA